MVPGYKYQRVGASSSQILLLPEMIKRTRHCYTERDRKKVNKENIIYINILQTKSSGLNMFLVLELRYNRFITMKAFLTNRVPNKLRSVADVCQEFRLFTSAAQKLPKELGSVTSVMHRLPSLGSARHRVPTNGEERLIFATHMVPQLR